MRLSYVEVDDSWLGKTLKVRVLTVEEDKKKLIIQLVDFEELKEENDRLRRILRGNQI